MAADGFVGGDRTASRRVLEIVGILVNEWCAKRARRAIELPESNAEVRSDYSSDIERVVRNIDDKEKQTISSAHSP